MKDFRPKRAMNFCGRALWLLIGILLALPELGYGAARIVERGTWLGAMSASAYIYGADAQGNYVYLAASLTGLRVLDVTDPDHPVEVGFASTRGNAIGVQVVGKYAYVASGGTPLPGTSDLADTGGLEVIDVSDPSHPVWRARLNIFGDGIENLRVVGPYAYVSGTAAGKLAVDVIDISDPLHPVFKSETPVDSNAVALRIAASVGGNLVSGITVAGHFAYASVIYDVSDTNHPVTVGQLPLSGFIVTMADNYLYTFTTDGHLQVIDMEDPAHAVLVREEAEPSRKAQGVEQRVFVASGFGGLRIFDATVFPATLGLRRGGNKVQFYWASDYSGLKLQTANSLTPPVQWADVPLNPTLAGKEYEVTINAPTKNEFYRLLRP
jgi:hypothetical protein